jgi:nuclear pore complex protein Nup54
VNRTIQDQIELIFNKWRPDHPNSTFQTYLYNYVGEAEAPFYGPRFGEDEAKWEEALQKRPGPGYIPVLARGFYDLGERLKRQNDYLLLMRSRLHEINNSLTAMLQNHDLALSVRAADCRRKHLVLSQRCLALATKAQVLKNRGFGMDAMEDDLKLKLEKLERSVFDPTLNGRAEEIWARMLAIRERSKTLQAQLERYGQEPAKGESVEIDEAAIKFAKSVSTETVRNIPKLMYNSNWRRMQSSYSTSTKS